jgi:hypothetical protein
MIESEVNRKLITEDIERWCKHTKVLPLLRNGDIQGLVSSIMSRFYHCTFSCGHQGNEDGVFLEFEDFIVDNSDILGGGMGTITGIYCADCARKLVKEHGATILKMP